MRTTAACEAFALDGSMPTICAINASKFHLTMLTTTALDAILFQFPMPTIIAFNTGTRKSAVNALAHLRVFGFSVGWLHIKYTHFLYSNYS
jgi:hypothetical protein